MAAAIYGGHVLLASMLDVTDTALARVVTLAVLVAVGLGVYVAALPLLGIARLRDLLAAVRGRL
jgi:hypothetical protein